MTDRQEDETITLGRLIDELKAHPQDHDVTFDFLGANPGTVDSFRGYYEQLAIGTGTTRRSVANLVAELKRAVGATFTGYKGGEYVMGLSTPVWVSNYGSSSQTTITGVTGNKHETVILTGWVSLWD